MKSRGLLDVVILAMLTGVLLAIWLGLRHDAWSYYATPIGVRGYEPEHRFLRPSGSGGHLLGVAGTLVLFSTLAYVARRRLRLLAKSGSVAHWLEIHIFCGVFGPILVTFHTSFKFNGVVSVAYWSMVLVVLSGFVGRYLYVRIPKTIRGEELTLAELDERVAQITKDAAQTTLPARQRAALQKERRVLVRRIARLDRTRRLFQLWHVFHRPLVWVMFLVFFVHLGVAVYFGYTPFGG